MLEKINNANRKAEEKAESKRRNIKSQIPGVVVLFGLR